MGHQPIDRHALHEYLFRKADRVGRVTIVGTELGEALGVSKFTISRIMRELQDDGRVYKLSQGKHRNTFVIRDPVGWR